MGQVTIYLDDETEKLMQAAVQSAGISKSKWIADLIRRRAVADWPEHVRDLAGAWPDFPLAEEIRASGAKDSKRGKL
ncbi:MAG: CopG family transcriptional regulator [Betaproteobacteria bacterium]|nr:CopG family transcriptional regulator [Betaproteobacteria bacterium]